MKPTRKPIICLTTSGSFDPAYPKTSRTLACPKSYSSAIAAAGGVPILAAEYCVEELVELCDGLLLTGGCDVEPTYYGEEKLNETVTTDGTRSAFEMALTRAFTERGKPIYGICRGIQVLNVFFGGTLYQDLPTQKGCVHEGSELRHDIIAEPNSILGRLYGQRFRVNSTHHQAVKDPAPRFRVTARSEEGIVEAVEHESLPMFGTQFHPERLTGDYGDERTADFADLFRYFVDTVRRDIERREKMRL